MAHASEHHHEPRIMPGGVCECPGGVENNLKIQDLARFAVDQFNKKQLPSFTPLLFLFSLSFNMLLEFVRVVRAKEQDVAGFLYHLTREAIDAGEKKICEAKMVEQAWKDLTELLEFKHDDAVLFTNSDFGVKGDGPGFQSVPTNEPQVQGAANHAVKIMQQRPNSQGPYEVLEVTDAKSEVKQGEKEEKFNVELQKNKAGTWQNDAEVYVDRNADNPSPVTILDNLVTNVVRIGGMTRSGRVYTPEEFQGEKMKEVVKDNNGKEKMREPAKVTKELSKEVLDKEASELLKLLKQSECIVVDPVNLIPTKISILSLLQNSELHRKLLLKILNEGHVSQDIMPEKFEGSVVNIIATNYLTFSDDELPTEGTCHNKALHISVRWQDCVLKKVLIDNGSAFNIMPKDTLSKLSVDMSHMRPTNKVIGAFDGSQRKVTGEMDLPIQIGPRVFKITFQVMNISPVYNCLLGRPWLHSAGVVPSTLHQRLKFIVNNKLVIVIAEDNELMRKPSPMHYIEVAEEPFKTSFQAHVKEGNSIVKPQLSRASKMVAQVIIKGGYKPEKGLGRNERGLANLIELYEK